MSLHEIDLPSPDTPLVVVTGGTGLIRSKPIRRLLPEHRGPETLGNGELEDIIHGTEWPTIEIREELATVGAWMPEKNPFGDGPFIRSWMIDRASDHHEIHVGKARRRLDWESAHRVVEVVPGMVEPLCQDRPGWYACNGLEPPRSADS